MHTTTQTHSPATLADAQPVPADKPIHHHPLCQRCNRVAYKVRGVWRCLCDQPRFATEKEGK